MNSQHLEVEERSWTDDDLDLLVRRRSLVLFTGEARAFQRVAMRCVMRKKNL